SKASLTTSNSQSSNLNITFRAPAELTAARTLGLSRTLTMRDNAGKTAMTYLIFKAALSGVIVVAVSEVARRSPSVAALIASLPLVSILAVIWLWRDTADAERVATLMSSTFWYVLPTLPMFLVMPSLLRHNMSFWVALAISCALTMALYVLLS